MHFGRPSSSPKRASAGRSSAPRRLAAREDGSALIEFAVTLPVLFTLLFCFMELCLALYTRDLISECAREGTRYAMVRGASCTTYPGSASCTVTAAQVETYVMGLGRPNIAGGTMSVNASYPNGTQAVGSPVSVTVNYAFPISMPFVHALSINMSSSSQMTIIQ